MSSQEIIDTFWKTNLGTSKTKLKSPSVLPSNVYAQMVRDHVLKGDVGGRSVTASYEEAVKDCEAKVALIVAECRRNNKKYNDPHFNLDDYDRCLMSLPTGRDEPAAGDALLSDNTISYEVTQRGFSRGEPIKWGDIQPEQPEEPKSDDIFPACAKRVGDIFDNPKFFVDGGARVKDTRQGSEGDCWFISALGSLCVDEEFPQLIERICPEKARDEKVGVYGFVFNRDGEWISEIIDDKLYLSAPDYDDCGERRRAIWDRAHSRMDAAVTREEYRKTFQSNSDALFHSSCAHPDETWVPLLEKAFAKAHGDYHAIDGGYPGEGVEDLTGGITTQITTADILDKDQLWEEGLLQVNKKFLFGASTRGYDHSDPSRQGIEDSHAYSVLKAVNYHKSRLLLVKNPWGDSEWTGPWSDGSKEWTPEALKALGHTFGDDGIFWIAYEDFLRRYTRLHRTRLFNPDWNVSQHWTTIQAARTVVVISQLDNSYFQSLTGQYEFDLAFRLHRIGESVHIIRGYASGSRSATAEVDLEAGTYEVLLQISGSRDSGKPKIEDVVKQNWLSRRDKLLRIGLSYDLAHAKGQIEHSQKSVEEKAPKSTEPKATETPKATESPKITETPMATETPKTTENPEATETDMAATAPPPPTTAEYDPPSANRPGDVDPIPPPDFISTMPGHSKTPAEEAWNAACVVGLRVFCHETIATIRVIWPDAEDVAGDAKTKLDVDDPEKDAAEKVDVNSVEAE